MPTQRTFSDVFEQILDTKQSENFAAGWESLLEPAGLSQLIGTLTPVTFTKPHIYRYPRAIRRSHIFNDEQAHAYQTLNSYQDVPLHPGFYTRELKSAYRAALLKTHPDQGGTAESFQQVRKSYEILVSFVTK